MRRHKLFTEGYSSTTKSNIFPITPASGANDSQDRLPNADHPIYKTPLTVTTDTKSTENGSATVAGAAVEKIPTAKLPSTTLNTELVVKTTGTIGVGNGNSLDIVPLPDNVVPGLVTSTVLPPQQPTVIVPMTGYDDHDTDEDDASTWNHKPVTIESTTNGEDVDLLSSTTVGDDHSKSTESDIRRGRKLEVGTVVDNDFAVPESTATVATLDSTENITRGEGDGGSDFGSTTEENQSKENTQYQAIENVWAWFRQFGLNFGNTNKPVQESLDEQPDKLLVVDDKAITEILTTTVPIMVTGSAEVSTMAAAAEAATAAVEVAEAATSNGSSVIAESDVTTPETLSEILLKNYGFKLEEHLAVKKKFQEDDTYQIPKKNEYLDDDLPIYYLPSDNANLGKCFLLYIENIPHKIIDKFLSRFE